jgi:hypothetical protein
MDFNFITEISKQKIITLLKSIDKEEATENPNKRFSVTDKVLVLDPETKGLISLVMDLGELPKYGVKKIYNLITVNNLPVEPVIIYICRSKIMYMKYIANTISAWTDLDSTKKIYLSYTTKSSVLCTNYLEQSNIFRCVCNTAPKPISILPPDVVASINKQLDLITSILDLSNQPEPKDDIIDKQVTIFGSKALVLDSSLKQLFDITIEQSRISNLRNHMITGVHDLAQITELDDTNILYVCKPLVANIKLINENIRKQAQWDKAKEFYFSLSTDLRLFSLDKIYGYKSIPDLDIDLIQLESDVISLEMNSVFGELFVHNDPTILYTVAKSINQFQNTFGLIKDIITMGTHAQKVKDLILQLDREQSNQNLDEVITSSIDKLILVDRSIDLLTVLCTQLTYEGLVDEIMAIEYQNTILDSKKIKLNDSDVIHKQIRDKNFSEIGSVLKQLTDIHGEKCADVKHDKTLKEIKEFVQNDLKPVMDERKCLAIHINTATQISSIISKPDFTKKISVEQNLISGTSTDTDIEYVKELIYKQEKLHIVLRLMCMLSLTTNGISVSVFEELKKEILQSYGYQNIFGLMALEQIGLLKSKDKSGVFDFVKKDQFDLVRKEFKLFTFADSVQSTKSDISYAYSGYAPLSVRMIQSVLAPKEKKNFLQFKMTDSDSESVHSTDEIINKKETIMIYFIGGCTYSEISCLRYLSKQSGSKYNYLIATTNIINGNSLMKQVIM